MRTAYIETLSELAKADPNVCAVISDNGAIVYDAYRAAFPGQFINAGISEANMVAMAAGMAERGMIPFAYTIGAFLAYRAFEFILNDVCMQNMNVKMVGIGAGCSYSLLGASHHTIFDLALLRPLPNLTIYSPASPREVRECVRAAYAVDGPVYIRLGTNGEREVYADGYDFKTGRAVKLRDGGDLSIISTGSIVADVLEAVEALGREGIYASVLNVHTVVPLDEAAIAEEVKRTGHVLVVEEHVVTGGLGTAVGEVVAKRGLDVRFGQVGFTALVHGYGKHADVKRANGLGVDAIVEAAKGILD